MLSQYNYPGNETGGEGNPYGYPYGNSPYPPRKSFLQRIKDYFLCDKYIVLSATVTVIGLCVILYQFLAMAYSLVLRSVPALLDRYTNDYMFSTVIEMFYTVICVGGSFGAGYLFMKKMGLSEKSLPFSSPYSGSDSVLLVVAGLGLCFFGNIVTNFFVTAMSSLGFEFASYNYALTAPVNLPENAFEFISEELKQDEEIKKIAKYITKSNIPITTKEHIPNKIPRTTFDIDFFFCTSIFSSIVKSKFSII